MTNDFNGILIITTASLCQNDDLIFELSLFEGAGEGEDIFIEIWIFDVIFMLLGVYVLYNEGFTSIYSW